MTKARVDNKKIIATIFEERNPWKATQMLLDSFDDPTGKDAAACYRAWGNIRAAICRRPDEYANPDYTREMMELQKNAMPWEEDFFKIAKIMNSSMGTRSCFEQSRQSKFSLQNKDLNTKMKTIRVFKPDFYGFVLPVSFAQASRRHRQNRDTSNQLHVYHDLSFYNFTEEEVEDVVLKSINCLTHCSSDNVRVFDILSSLQIVTGRRKTELISTASINIVPSEPFQMKMSGFSKMDKVDILDCDNQDERVVPLLCRYELVSHGIKLLRDNKQLLGSPGNHRRELDRAQQKLFGRRIVHTQYRGIYIAIAYKNRRLNNFYPDVSRDIFNVYALGHKPQFSVTQAYSLINVEPAN